MRNDTVLQKMHKYSTKLIDYCSGYTYGSFSSDIKLVEACVFNLSQLGELCHFVDSTFAQAHPEIPWREMYGLRNRIVHDYEGVNLRLVWEIIMRIFRNCGISSKI
ncbi:HepT-like ribonuclease domain-containing protein [Hominifimenecus sp. rT4P-3]|uniref:HepT-like ribonuclease domain-containing protein n=1 Tax=Hominifimenecus sp. rT4P-3 TaxID=3242979 RepID=UPI003DA65404